MAGNVVFLVGYMGSGKTTLGRKLAKHLDWSFVDLDHQIAAHAGMSIPDYFDAHGETGFRTIERDTLRALDLSRPAVIATGGGTPCFHANMEWMNEHGKTVYLDMDSKALWQRLRKSKLSSRPVLQGLGGDELLRFIEEKLTERLPFYRQARFAINPMQTTLREIAERCNLETDN